MSGKIRKSKEKNGEIVAFSESAMRHNGAVLEYIRTSVSVLSGCSAGIMGLTSLYGFLFYFVVAVVLWAMLVVSTLTTWETFLRSRATFFTHGLFNGLFTYILFWTFSYGMVHVY